MEKYGGVRQAIGDNITRRMRFASTITKDTDTHSQYVILIVFPPQQWLHERASVLRYSYIKHILLDCKDARNCRMNSINGEWLTRIKK